MATNTTPPELSREAGDEAHIEEVARRVYDEMRHFVSVPASMTNQIYRYGFMPKKSVYGSGTTRLHGSRRYWRDSRTVTPDGARIIHRDDADPNPGNCQGFIHPPYTSEQQYRGEKGREYLVSVSLAKLRLGAKECGFCSILYQGICLRKDDWASKLARYKQIKAYPDGDLSQVEDEESCDQDAADEVDEDQVRVSISFPKGRHPLVVYLHISDPASPTVDVQSPRTTEDIRESLQSDGAGKRLGELEFYTPLDAPSLWFAFGPAPHVQPKVLTHACLNRIGQWLADCVLDHEACQTSPWVREPEADTAQLTSMTSPRRFSLKKLLRKGNKPAKKTDKVPAENLRFSNAALPTRLLKIRWGDGEEASPLASLEETINPNNVYRYVALSHVWSFTTPYKTTIANYAQHKKEVPWDDLSLPLRQAIGLILNQRLDLEYIWIDSLCIIQDDASDKLHELPRMGSIYSRAEIVFAVHGPDLGFHKEPLTLIRDATRPDDPPVYCRQRIPHDNLYAAPQGPDSWFGRAWCMQERIFAPRILHFGGMGEEIWFECNTLSTCECGGVQREDAASQPLTLKQRVTKGFQALAESGKGRDLITFRDELWRIYITACEDYTPRGLSFPADKLPAVSSLMHTFLPHLGKYHAGLWEHNLILNIQWEVSDTMRSQRYKAYVSPSWSWAAVSGGVVWYIDTKDLPTPETHSFAAVVDVFAELATDDVCGQVSSATVTLRGFVTTMQIEASKLQWMPDGRIAMTKEGMDSAFVTLDSRDDYELVEPGMTVTCLDVMRDKNGLHGNFVSGLVLLPISQTHTTQYRRIGFSTMLEAHFIDAEVQTIVFV